MGEEPNSGGDGGDIGGLRRTRVWGGETGDSVTVGRGEEMSDCVELC
jgi:hypothetical protein